MSQQTIRLAEVDAVEVMIVQDNSLDILLPTTKVAQRLLSRLGPNPFDRAESLPFAEHGVSIALSFRKADKSGTVLFDTGTSRRGLLNNIDALEIDPKGLNAIVLSHGHPDHAMGLPGLVDRLGSRSMPLVLHPDAYLERKLVLPNGDELMLPAPKKQDFARENIEIIEEVGPSMLVDDMLLISGEMARTTDFETGFPSHHAKHHDAWEPDPLIMDDQCAILNVKDKGLVVVTGCGHAGIINTIRHAQALTGVADVYAAIGGFHLTGGLFERIIPDTIKALKAIGPKYLVPGHCTGWVATHQIAREMPEAFIPPAVGTNLLL
jgi:7,8-dihydropterin-6-yl-methyl-4-(beta-D-ribofuranosyl)aminobenzene 5'-phosphate synthase